MTCKFWRFPKNCRLTFTWNLFLENFSTYMKIFCYLYTLLKRLENCLKFVFGGVEFRVSHGRFPSKNGQANPPGGIRNHGCGACPPNMGFSGGACPQEKLLGGGGVKLTAKISRYLVLKGQKIFNDPLKTCFLDESRGISGKIFENPNFWPKLNFTTLLVKAY